MSFHRMRREHEEEIDHRLAEQRALYTSELEKTVSRDSRDYDLLKQQIADLELKLKLQKEEMEMAHEKEKAAMLDRFDDDRADLEGKQRLKIQEYERMFEQVSCSDVIVLRSLYNCSFQKSIFNDVMLLCTANEFIDFPLSVNQTFEASW